MSENLDMSRILRYGDIVRHFKRELINEELEDPMLYYYMVISKATHTETKEKFVIYQALYNNDEMNVHMDCYARPLNMFFSEVDHEKYPNIKQKYRFERIEGEEKTKVMKYMLKNACLKSMASESINNEDKPCI